jgi:hypothetical protein
MSTLEQLCLHPERNSSSILRADILHDTESSSSSSPENGDLPLAFRYPSTMIERRRLRRKLLPRKPNVDKPLEQDCLFLVDRDPLSQQGMVVLLPDVKEEKDVPFYHPILRKLAFEYRPSSDFQESDDPNTVPRGMIRISALPFPSSSSDETNPVQEALSARAETGSVVNKLLPQRTIRTCMHLLETLYKHAWGAERGYEKRVIHDVSDFDTHFDALHRSNYVRSPGPGRPRKFPRSLSRPERKAQAFGLAETEGRIQPGRRCQEACLEGMSQRACSSNGIGFHSSYTYPLENRTLRLLAS